VDDRRERGGDDHRRVHAHDTGQEPRLRRGDPRAGPGYGQPGTDEVVWEHGRRNFSLRADKLLAIVCPVRDDSDVCGIAIFDGGVDEVRRIMDDDPGVRAGVFTYEVHPCRSFPGDALPG
jgi:hypothetical protein